MSVGTYDPLVPTRAAYDLLGFRTRAVRTSVGRVVALDAPGPPGRLPLVALHGFASSSFDYLRFLLRVRPDTGRLLAPDLPAHGRSETPAGGLTSATLQAGLVEALDALVDRPSVFFGNSMGGHAAIRYAALRPERVAGLVLCSPGGARMTDAELQAFLAQFRVEDEKQALAFLERLLSAPPLGLFRKPLAWNVRRKLTREAMRSLIDSVTALDLLQPEEVEGLRVPTLILWGQQERLLPDECLRFYERHLPPRGRIERPARFGHAPHVEHPVELARRVRRFVREVELHRTADVLRASRRPRPRRDAPPPVVPTAPAAPAAPALWTQGAGRP